MKSYAALTLAAYVSLVCAPPVEAQNWCRKVGLSDAEKLICARAGLQKRDREVNAIYREALRLTKPGSAVGIRESQHIWLGNRNASGRDEACVAASYDKRAAVLKRYIATGELDGE